ncbi:glycosyltransferase [Proteiniborus sp.]|uniref:glycosyltransferase n=1 Tax=Proteiniborus sp. TaxID=2079015 RepID=UPI00332750C1
MNIVIYKGQFQYDVVNYFVEELGHELMKLGHNVHILNLLTMSSNRIEGILANNKIDLVLSFNGVNFTGKEIYEKLNIPLGIILVDHPFYHISRIKTYKSNNTFICMFDEGSLECFEECIADDISISWLAHGGTEMLSSEVVEKSTDVIMPGSLSDYNKLERQLLDLDLDILKRFACNLYEKGKYNYNIPLYNFFKEELRSAGIELKQIREDEDFLNAFSYIYTLVDRTLRARNRYRIIKVLIEEGIRVQHYGNLSNNELLKYKNFKTNGPIDYIALTKEIQRSKILLHDTPYFENGSHERVLTSMLNETLVLSNNNNYCNNLYKEGESIIFYDMNNLDTLVEKTSFYLEHENERKRVENKAYEITQQYNTWESRAHEILNIYNAFIGRNAQ